jgi:hypothetical protein
MSQFLSMAELRAQEEAKQREREEIEKKRQETAFKLYMDRHLKVIFTTWERYANAREFRDASVEPVISESCFLLHGDSVNEMAGLLGRFWFKLIISSTRRHGQMTLEVPTRWEIDPSDLAQAIATETGAPVTVKSADGRIRQHYAVQLSNKPPATYFRPQKKKSGDESPPEAGAS